MPWNNQGGGNNPWGSSGGSGGGGGGNNPWGRPPSGGGGGGGPTPPDFEDMIRKGQDRVKQMVPKRFGGGRGIAIIAAIVILAVLASSMVYQVNPEQQAVVQRFGEYVRTEGPGLNFKLPDPIETVTLPSVQRINRINVGFEQQTNRVDDRPEESIMLTGDENLIDIDFTVLWRISSARDFLFNVRDVEDTVKVAAESAMREIIGRTDIQPALTEARDLIQAQTRSTLQQILDGYSAGIEVTEVQLQRVDPPAPVVDAFNDVQRARQDQQRLRNQAEAYRNDIIPRARGDAERLIQEASAYREQVVAQAVGESDRFLNVLRSFELSPEVTTQRFYIETMEEVMRETNKIIIDGDVGGGQGGSGVVPYLPLNELRR